MHVLKPEAINTTGEKKIYRMYLQTIKNIYIYLYIYIYKIHSKGIVRQLCTNKAPEVNEQTNQVENKQMRKKECQGDERKHGN